MVGRRHSCNFQGYWEGCIRQYLNRIAGFQVALANTGLTGELPARGHVIHERIVERFCDFVADRGYVLKSSAKDSRGNPARELGRPAVLRRAEVGKVGVET